MEELTYTKAMEELESIVKSVEENRLDIDSLADRLKRAQQLVKFCRERLQKTEKEVSGILASEEMQTGGAQPAPPAQENSPFSAPDLPF